jgi:polyhydroxybutyrate depolymerase
MRMFGRMCWRLRTRAAVTVGVLALLTGMSVLAGCGAAAQGLRGNVSARTSTGAAAGSSAGTAIPAGSSAHTISVDGVPRTYLVYRPAGLAAAAPLVVMLHGGFGSGSQAEKSYGWDAEADAGHFLVAYPDGLDRAWNAGGGCCGQPAKDNTDDTGFITAMVAAIEHAVPVDARRVYATGISNGGILAYRLACTTRIFAAIGPDSATQLGSCADPAPVSVIAVHGTADQRIPYNGGEGSGVAHIDGPAVPAVNAAWRRTDDCATPRSTVAGPVTTSVASCPSGRAVELVTIAGAGHQWPGSVSKPVMQKLLGTDPPSTALNATAVLWQFFAAHAR